MSSTLPLSDPKTDIVGELLREQQSLTAVERFSALHEAGEVGGGPSQEKYYRNLLPASPPAPGQQFAFEVDLDKCSGCKACVVACHTLNGLEEDESWRRVGTITIGQPIGDTLPVVQHVTTACHHCEDPGCLNGCPVKAYEKDSVTGIVRHLDDQCIGCKYCTMMCPYEVPKYSDRLGIVRKCDMCHQRLSVGEAPACVQACPNEAIAITKVDSAALPINDRLAPGAPSSSISKPSTRYKTSQADQVDLGVPQDVGIDQVAENHWPLAAMLVATQVSVGMILCERLVALLWIFQGAETNDSLTRLVATIALVIGGVGLNLAPLHLGRPLRAWRVFLGLRTSWLSREAIILGKYMGLLGAAVGLMWLPAFGNALPEFLSKWTPSWAAKAALGLSLPVGIVGLYSSAMIYIATQRKLWRYSRTLVRFGGTTILSGLGFLAASCAWYQLANSAAFLALASVAILVAKLVYEWRVHLGTGMHDSLDLRSNRLVDAELGQWKAGRVKGAMLGGLIIVLGSLCTFFAPTLGSMLILLGSLVVVAGEFAERILYFSSVVYQRMPGTL